MLKISVKSNFYVVVMFSLLILIFTGFSESFAAQDNITIEGDENPINRSKELYVVKVSPSDEYRDIVLSIYGPDGLVSSQKSYVRAGSNYENFFVTFFPPLYQSGEKYVIEVTGPGLIGRKTITIHEQYQNIETKQIIPPKIQTQPKIQVPPPLEKSYNTQCAGSFYNGAPDFQLTQDNSIFIPETKGIICKITPDGKFSKIDFSDVLNDGYANHFHIDKKNNLFFQGYAHTWENSIYKVTSSGFHLLDFDVIDNLGTIHGITGLTTDHNGNIYVKNQHHDILKFNQAGIYVETLNLPSNDFISQIVFDSKNNLYYASMTLEGIPQLNKMSPNGNVRTIVVGHGVTCVSDLEIDSIGNIYVATCPNNIDISSKKYNSNGDLLFEFETNLKPEYDNIHKIEIGSNGKLYGLKYRTSDIILFRDKFIDDRAPPTISSVNDIAIDTTNSKESIVTFSPTAIDAIDGPMDVTCSPKSGTLFPVGIHPVTCTSTDYSYNSSFETFDVTVNYVPLDINPLTEDGLFENSNQNDQTDNRLSDNSKDPPYGLIGLVVFVMMIIIPIAFIKSRKKKSNSYRQNEQSRRSQSSSYRNYSQSGYSQSGYSQSGYSQSDNSSKKGRFRDARMSRINARLEKFQITTNDAQIIFGKAWMAKLGKPEWEFYYVVRKIEINIQYDYNNRYRRKFGGLYSKVLQIIQIVMDENPEMRQAEEQFEQQGYRDDFEDEFNDHEQYEPSEFTEEDIAEAFGILGLSPISTKDQIKSKYRELILKHHPDKNKLVDSTTKMAEINNAYDIIMRSIE